MLQTLTPQLADGDFVFVTFPDATYGDGGTLSPIAAMMESEGLTLVVPRPKAEEAGIPYEGVFCCITLSVHSSLQAVGLTAAFSRKLTEPGISANVIAGFYHDHLFVQHEDADRAMAALAELRNP